MTAPTLTRWTDTPEAKVARFDTLRREHLAKLNEIIRCDGLGMAEVTAPLAHSARSYRAKLRAVCNIPEAHSPVSRYGPLGDWGSNGVGPAIDDMLTSARFAAVVANAVGIAA